MVISKRRHLNNLVLALTMVGALIIVGASVLNKCFIHRDVINEMCINATIAGGVILLLAIIAIVVRHKGIRGLITHLRLIDSVEKNLLSIGAYKKEEGSFVGTLPKIKLGANTIRISLADLKIRSTIEKYMASFSTALPERYIVEDYYITQNGAEMVICYENIRNYQPERYALSEYKRLVTSMQQTELYIDKKHTISLIDYPHLLISGGTGSGKSYFAQELIIQAAIKGWEIVILDLKRSYGIYKEYSEYVYEPEEIVTKLQSVEAEMHERMEKLQPELDHRPGALATDIGYKPQIVLIEEYISLQSSLDKKKKEELERVVKNLSVLARQSCIHLLLVLQSAGTENIQSSTRHNFVKILLGNAQSNILTATFGSGTDIPTVNTKMQKGQGLIQLDRITVIRVPKITDMDNLKNVIGGAP